jgi:hypothetical protein
VADDLDPAAVAEALMAQLSGELERALATARQQQALLRSSLATVIGYLER